MNAQVQTENTYSVQDDENPSDEGEYTIPQEFIGVPPAPFEIPRYYKKIMKIKAILHHNQALFRKSTAEERKNIKDVFSWSMTKFYKLPVFMIDNYITEHKINIYEEIRKMYDYDNASQCFISNIFKVNNIWFNYNVKGIETYMNMKRYYKYKDKLLMAFNTGYNKDDYTEFFELYYKGF
jgi:hypothetical protein